MRLHERHQGLIARESHRGLAELSRTPPAAWSKPPALEAAPRIINLRERPWNQLTLDSDRLWAAKVTIAILAASIHETSTFRHLRQAIGDAEHAIKCGPEFKNNRGASSYASNTTWAVSSLGGDGRNRLFPEELIYGASVGNIHTRIINSANVFTVRYTGLGDLVAARNIRSPSA